VLPLDKALSMAVTQASGGSISWAYNWAGSLSGLLPSGVEFVPMLWGPKC
jgi:hypothetical protein